MKEPIELSTTARIYSAGIVDGEGYVGLVIKHSDRITPSYFPQVQIGNTNRPLIEYLQRILKRTSFSKDDRYRKPTYIIALQNIQDTKTFLEQIEPYLIVKKPQAGILLKYCNSRLARGLRSRYSDEERNYYALLRVLNKKGRKRDETPDAG